jgi:hypothetical protein
MHCAMFCNVVRFHIQELLAPRRPRVFIIFAVTPISGGRSSVLNARYYSRDQIRKMRWAGHVARMGDSRGAYTGLVGRPEWERDHL